MFSGLVVERGRLAAAPEESGRGGMRLAILHGERLGERLPVGASLAVSGVCLTVVERSPGRSEVELSPETLDRTNLGGLAAGDLVNLEPALAVGEPLGGHWVQGHVDATVELLGREPHGDHLTIRVALPAELSPYVVEKGSVALDGVSLTVAGRTADAFTVALIRHTLEVTTLGDRRPGDRLNLETDVLAKYVAHQLAGRGLPAGESGGAG
jgi:riboflavin synthase